MPANKAHATERAGQPARRETVGAVEHAIAVLRCLSEAGSSLGVNEVARRIGLHKSSVSRIVGTLEGARIIQREPATGQVSLGIGLVALAAPVLANFAARDLVKPLLKELAVSVGETVSFSIWDGREAVSIEHVSGSNSIQVFSRPGHRDPGHASASGKALLAHLGEGAIEAYCRKPLERFTENTVTNKANLIEELVRCREQGFAVNIGELESDVGAVAAVVLDRAASPIGAVTIVVPVYRFHHKRRTELAGAVTACATELSARIGHVRAISRLGRAESESGT
jgi:DNA-binding IclR family transcriptional regulator